MPQAALQVRIDGRGAAIEAAQLNRNLDRLARTGDRVERNTRRIGGAADFMRRAFAALSLGVVAQQFLSVNTQVDKLRGQLETLVGPRADAAFDAIEQFAKTTPFALEQSVQAFVKMRALGLEPTERALTSFGNTAVAMGKDLNQFVEAVADAITGEFERLKEFGIKTKTEGDRIKFTFQGVTTEVGKNAEEITEFLTSIGENNFAGAMEKQMERLPGLLSNLGDEVRGVIRDLGDAGLTEIMRRGLEVGIEKFAALRAFVRDEMGPEIERLKARFQTWSTVSLAAVRRVRLGIAELLGSEVSQLFTERHGFAILQEVLADLPILAEFAFGAILEIAGAELDNLELRFDKTRAATAHVFAVIENVGTTTWLEIQLAFAEMADWIVNRYADMISSIGAATAALPLGGELAVQLLGAADALREYGNAAADIERDIRVQERAHNLVVAALDAEIARLDRAILARGTAASDNIRGLAQQRDAAILARRAAAELAAEEERLRQETERTSGSLDEFAGAAGGAGDSSDDLTFDLKEQAKAFRELEDELDPVLALKRQFEEAIEVLDNELEKRGLPFLERYMELLNLLKQSYMEASQEAAGMRDQADPFGEAWVGAIERIDEVFADVWTGAFDGFEDFAQQLKRAFLQLLGELAHAAITRPILVQLGLGGAGGAGGTGGAAGQTGGLAGLGSLLGPAGIVGALGGAATGSTGAGIGAGLGYLGASTVAGATALGSAPIISTLVQSVGGFVVPIIGALIGAAVGMLLESLFSGDNPDPRIRLSNTQVDPRGQYGGEFARASAFGTGDNPLTISGTRITETFGRDAANQFLDAVQGFDEAIADLLDPAQIDAVRNAILGPAGESGTTFTGDISVEEALGLRLDTILSALDPAIEQFVNGIGGSLEDRLNSLQIALTIQDIVDTTEALDTLGEAFDLIAQIGGDPVEAINKLLELTEAIQGNINVLQAFADSDLATEYSNAVEAAGRSLVEQIAFVDEGLAELARSETFTAETVGEITQLVQARYTLELQLLAQIDGAIADITTRFGSRIEQLQRIQETDEQTYDRLTTEAERLTNLLFSGSVTDPGEIQRIASEIERLAGEAQGFLTPEQQLATAAETISFLEQVRDEAVRQLGDARTDALANAELMRDMIGELAERLPEPLILAADALIGSANALNDAAESLGGGPAGSGRGAGRGGDEEGPVGKALVGEVKASNEEQRRFNAKLTNELVQSRENAARNQRILATAIASVSRGTGRASVPRVNRR